MTRQDGAFISTLAALVAAVSLLERGGRKAAPSNAMFEQMMKDYNNAIEQGRAALATPLQPAKPITVEDLLQFLDHCLTQDGRGHITFAYREDTHVTDDVEQAVKRINAHFLPEKELPHA